MVVGCDWQEKQVLVRSALRAEKSTEIGPPGRGSTVNIRLRRNLLKVNTWSAPPVKITSDFCRDPDCDFSKGFPLQFSSHPGPVTCDTEPVLTSRAFGTGQACFPKLHISSAKYGHRPEKIFREEGCSSSRLDLRSRPRHEFTR